MNPILWAAGCLFVMALIVQMVTRSPRGAAARVLIAGVMAALFAYPAALPLPLNLRAFTGAAAVLPLAWAAGCVFVAALVTENLAHAPATIRERVNYAGAMVFIFAPLLLGLALFPTVN